MPLAVFVLLAWAVLAGMGLGLVWLGRRLGQDQAGKYSWRDDSAAVDESGLDPDAAAELKLVRAQAAALQDPRHRGLRKARARLHERSSARLAASHVNKQRHRSLVLLIFGVVRIIAWIIIAACVGAGLLHLGGFSWAKDMAESLPFVVLISIYANAATDLDAATAAFAALVASDSHAAVVSTGSALSAGLGGLEDDIARLAELSPGAEATALAAEIRRKLTA